MHESGWHAVGPLADIPEATLHEAVVGDEPLLLVRHAEAVQAFAAHCPHKFTPLAGGHLDGMHLTCPMHTATFDLATGHPVPGHEWAGRLPVYPTRVREGVLEVRLPT